METPVLIRKVAEPFGWLGNMSPHPVTYNGESYRTTEALFQALRFMDENVRDEIRAAKSPMGAKMVAKKHKTAMTTEPRSEEDVAHMRRVLRVKLEQHPELVDALRQTRGREIIEDCSKRPSTSGLFWGAALKGGAWVGENMLGKLWMELRDEGQKPETCPECGSPEVATWVGGPPGVSRVCEDCGHGW